jgi:transcriptional regulator with XRE-family HTH domain
MLETFMFPNIASWKPDVNTSFQVFRYGGNMALTKLEVGERLQAALSGRTLREIADVLGVSHTAVRNWFSGKALPEVERLLDLCHEFGLSADHLLGIEVAQPASPGSDEYRPVPLLEQRVCAGPGAVIDPAAGIEEWHAMRKSWLLGRVQYQAVRVRVHERHALGTSMVNTILPGAVLTVDLGPVGRVDRGSIYLVLDNDQGVTVKRVYPLAKKREFLCVSDNRAFPPFEISEKEGARIVGRVLRWEQGEDD